MPNYHAPQSVLGPDATALQMSSEDILTASVDVDAAALEFEFISESYCPDTHPARLGVQQALRNFNGTEAIRIAEDHLGTLLRVDPTAKHELALSHALVAETYEEVGDAYSALAHWKSATEALRRCSPDLKPLKADLFVNLACCQVLDGELDKGLSSFRHARRIYRELEKEGASISRVVNEQLVEFGDALRQGGHIEPACRIYTQALRRSQSGRGSPLSGVSAEIGLARCDLDIERPDSAHARFLKVRDSLEDAKLKGHELYFYAQAGLAEARFSLGAEHWPSALHVLDESLSSMDRAKREQSLLAAHVCLIAGGLHSGSDIREDLDLAVKYLDKCVSFAGRSSEHPRLMLIEAFTALAPCLHQLGEYKREGQVLKQLLSLTQAQYGLDHVDTIHVRQGRMNYFDTMRRWSEALEEAEAIAALVNKKHGGLSVEHVGALRDWALTASHAGRGEEAIVLLWTARRIAKQLPADDRRCLIGIYSERAEIHEENGSYGQAYKNARHAYRLALRVHGLEHVTTAETELGLARALNNLAVPRSDAATRHAEGALEFFAKQEPVDMHGMGRAYHMRATINHTKRDFAEALTDFELAARHYSKAEDLFILARDQAICVVEKAEFYGIRQEREESFEFVATTIREAEAAGFGERKELLDLLQLAVNLARDLDLQHELVLYQNSYRRLDAKVKLPLV